MKKKRLILFFIATAFALIVSELFLRFLLPIEDPYIDFKKIKYGFIYSEYPKDFEIFTQTEEGLPGMDSKVRKFSTNYYTFRGDLLSNPKPKDEFRIIALGGSTTENFYLDDEETWTRILQNTLDSKFKNKEIKVYAAAKSGDRMDNHIAMLAQRAIHLEPDMIILLAGVNDLLTNATGYDPYHFPAEVEIKLGRILKLLATEFQIPRYVHKFITNLNESAKDKDLLQRVPLKSDFKKKVAFARNAPETSDKPVFKDKAYKEDLKTFIGIAKLNKVQLVLVTQPTSWNSKIDSQTRNWHWLLYRNGKYYREDIMDQAMQMVNEITKKTGEQENVAVYDSAVRMPKSMQYYYDDVHFNVKGAEKFAEDLAAFLITHNLVNSW